LQDFAKSPEWTRALTSKVEDILKERNPGPKFITLKDPENYQLEEKDVVWPAFPDALDESNEDHLKLADKPEDMDLGDRRSQTIYPKQDEYCEWTVARRGKNIIKVVFTTEWREVRFFLILCPLIWMLTSVNSSGTSFAERSQTSSETTKMQRAELSST
jgi:hypothetical protein